MWRRYLLSAIPVWLAAATPAPAFIAYVSNEKSNTVSVIDTTTKIVVVPSIPVGASPTGVAVTPDGSHVYVTNFGAATVSVIDTTTNTVVATIPVGVNPSGVAATDRNVYVANFGSNTVSVIDI